jgi:hypothetical protein
MFNVMTNSLKNELAIDAFDMKNIYKNSSISIPVLRPIATMKKIKNIFLLKLFLYTLVLLWFVIFPLLLMYKLWKYILLLKYKQTIDTYDNKIVIATSSRIQDVYNGVDEALSPKQWLIVPWVKIEKIDFYKYEKIELFSLLTSKDLLVSFYHSFIGLFIWAKNIKHPVEILHSYVLFEYFMMHEALDKLKVRGVKEYWYSNHYDRWAVLFDSCKQKNVLLQHGFINDRFNLPYKMNNLKSIYYIDEPSIEIFKNNILENTIKIQFSQLKNTLQLTMIKEKEKAIFLISRPAQFEFDVELLKKLSDLDIIVYIKPHPLFDKSMYRKTFKNNVHCILIEDDNFYPATTIVLSGYSTLAIEYELLGKKIIWIPKETIKSIKEKVINYIGGNKNVQK